MFASRHLIRSRLGLSLRTAIAAGFLFAVLACLAHSSRRLTAAQASPLTIDGAQVYQTLDGMGVNAMSLSRTPTEMRGPSCRLRSPRGCCAR